MTGSTAISRLAFWPEPSPAPPSDDHLPAELLKAREAADVARVDDLLEQVCELRERALGILGRAEKADDWRASIAAIREARGCVELLAKLAGQLKDAPMRTHLGASPE